MTQPAPAVGLVVDADPASSAQLADVLQAVGLRAVIAPDAAEALHRFHASRPAVVLLDAELPDVSPTALLHQFRRSAGAPVIVLSRKPDVAAAVRAVRAGAADVLDRATAVEDLVRAVRDVVISRRGAPNDIVPADLAAVLAAYPRFFKHSDKMRAVERLVLEIAPMDAPVLVLGEPGVGKEALARILHYLSPRSGEPLVTVNCTGLPEAVLDAELFGEAAAPGKVGRLQQARGGSLVIAEISEMPAGPQARIVHLLRDGEYATAGRAGLQPAGARIIATAQKDLHELAARGAMREDLPDAFPWRITIPPLRERREEIPVLVRDYLERFSRELGRERCALSQPTLDLMLQYDWPGNVRELANVVKRRVVMDDEDHLRDEIQARMRVARGRDAARPGASVGPGRPDPGLRVIARQAAEQAELAAIRTVLESVGWNRAAAARRLKISYKTLLNKLERGRLTPPPGVRGRRARK